MASNISCCGIMCPECPDYQARCAGCRASCGKSHWLPDAGLELCPLYACAAQLGLTSCGQCPSLPCDKFFNLKDPSLSDEEFKAGILDRVSLLRSVYYA